MSNNSNLYIVDYDSYIIDKKIESEKYNILSEKITQVSRQYIILYLQNFYNCDIYTLDKYKEIYGDYPDCFISKDLSIEKSRILNISRQMKINKLSKNVFR